MSCVWALILKAPHTLRMCEIMILREITGAKKKEVTGGRSKLHKYELHELYSFADVVGSKQE